jgi:low affinity Fe/Cu permease
VARRSGSPVAFSVAVLSVLVWAVSGPFFGWSDTWQLIANTATTLVTFLMVFVIQHTQNYDTAELKALLHEIAEDLPEVNHEAAARRVAEEGG